MSAEHRPKNPDTPKKGTGKELSRRQLPSSEENGTRTTRIPEIHQKEVLDQPIRRPRAAIQTDLVSVQSLFVQQEEQLQSFEDQYNNLPDTQKEIVDTLLGQLEEGEPTDDTAVAELSQEARLLLDQTQPLVQEALVLQEQERALKEETLPYLKEDIEQASRNLLARIDYDAVFAYYGGKAKEPFKEGATTDYLERTIEEMYLIRKYGYEATKASEDKNYDYFDGAQLMINESEEMWANRGFLQREGDEEQLVIDVDLPDREMRERLLQDVTTADKQLRRYGDLVSTYRPGVFQHTEHVDNELWHLKGAFDVSSWNDHYLENLEDIEFDPRLLDAAKRYVDTKLDGHRRAGRLPKTDKILAEENQERHHRTNLDTAYDHIAFNGFEPPEGMVSVFDQQAFIERAKKILPPDFVEGLESISYVADYVQDPEKDYEVDGRMIPVFGEGDQWDTIISRKIEIYATPFVPETMELIDKLVEASYFKDIVDHEIAHNAHNIADFDEMDKWEETMEADQTAVTGYVQDSRKIKEKKGKFEDFAETAGIYSRDPLLLFILSEPRYRYMDWYFKRHLPYQQQSISEREKELKLYSSLQAYQNRYPDKSFDEIKEELRKMYLAHEQEE